MAGGTGIITVVCRRSPVRLIHPCANFYSTEIRSIIVIYRSQDKALSDTSDGGPGGEVFFDVSTDNAYVRAEEWSSYPFNSPIFFQQMVPLPSRILPSLAQANTLRMVYRWP